MGALLERTRLQGDRCRYIPVGRKRQIEPIHPAQSQYRPTRCRYPGLRLCADSRRNRTPERTRDILDDSREMKHGTKIQLVISTPNVGFVIIRLMLLLGQFNYGKRGILDLTHTRLFTFSSLRHLLEQRGFQVTKSRGIPAPYPVALGDNPVSRFLVKVNRWWLRIFPTLFSYQILVLAVPEPSLELLLQTAIIESATRASTLKSASG